MSYRRFNKGGRVAKRQFLEKKSWPEKLAFNVNSSIAFIFKMVSLTGLWMILKIIQKTISYYCLCNVYSLLNNKNIRFDFEDELKIGNVRYDNMTLTTIKVQLFWRLKYEA